MDPGNAVVRLCVGGMQCEASGHFDEAAELFMNAWSESGDDYERCIAAHYVARHQKTAAAALEWNERSLLLAGRVGDERVREFYPSLYLNVGKALEDLGRDDDAQRFYEMAAGVLDSLADDRYATVVRDAVERALARVRTK